MKRTIKAIALIFVLATLACMSFGCFYTEPSSKEAAEKHLKHDSDDLTYMVQWLQDTEQSYVAFCRTWDHALVGLDKVPIDEEIAPVVKRLLRQHRTTRENYAGVARMIDLLWKTFLFHITQHTESSCQAGPVSQNQIRKCE